MTMPHLMNCPHRAESHCLDCVKAEWERQEAEKAALKAEAERNQWALNALVALEAAVRESVIRPTKDTEVNATNALLTMAGDNRQLRSELARFKEAAELLGVAFAYGLPTDKPTTDDARRFARSCEAVMNNPTATALVEQARKEKP